MVLVVTISPTAKTSYSTLDAAIPSILLAAV
jgi:hypothetical protein